LVRQALKLCDWNRGNSQALDLQVVEFEDIGIFELCLSASAGSSYGVQIAFFEDVTGVVQIIGARRGGEPLDNQFRSTLLARRTLIEQRISNIY
jgi:hypothetical protein